MITERTRTLDLLRNYSESVKPQVQNLGRSSHVSAYLDDHLLLAPSASENNQTGHKISLGPQTDWYANLPSISLSDKEVELARKYMNIEFEIKKENVMGNSLEQRVELYEAQDSNDTFKFIFWSTLLSTVLFILCYFWFTTTKQYNANVAREQAVVITQESNSNTNSIQNHVASSTETTNITSDITGLGDGISTSIEAIDAKATIENQAFDCAIIVGAFGNENNVGRMVDKLNEMGYAAHLESRGALTLVGAKAMSSDKNALEELRKAINSEAWYIHFDK